jgi:putative redox protein
MGVAAKEKCMPDSSDIIVTFGGGKKVIAEINGHVILTDQPRDAGGDDSAPPPYSLFLASIGTCAGIYVLGFLQARQLPTEGVRLRQSVEFDPSTHLLRAVHLAVELPSAIPEKYHAAILRAVEACAVKRSVQANPSFTVQIAAARPA